jgi:hypothetical protein
MFISVFLDTWWLLLFSQDRVIKTVAHHHSNGGATKAVYSGDGQCIFTIGCDNVLSCWQWNFTQMGKKQSYVYIRVLRLYQNAKTEHTLILF